MSRKGLFITVAGLLLVVFVVATVVFQSNKNTSVNQNQSALERAGAPVKGPADAKVTIVEFFDPACGTCREFYPFTQQLINQYPGKVRVMMRYAPRHTGSGQVVKMLEAAHMQGKFWPALELLFNNQQRWVVNHASQPMSAWGILGDLDLDRKKLMSDMNLAAVAQVIQQDVADGQTLKVQATPEFFVNGRPMPSFGYEQLSQLVKEAVDDAY